MLYSKDMIRKIGSFLNVDLCAKKWEGYVKSQSLMKTSQAEDQYMQINRYLTTNSNNTRMIFIVLSFMTV